MNNEKLPLESLNIPILYSPNQSFVKIRNQPKEKVSGPDPLNHHYIRYSDIQIR